MNKLFEATQFGDLKLKNRIVMAPLTRARASIDRIPTDMMVEYYKQRASAGLIITEGTIISPQAAGYHRSPGIWNKDQVLAWKKITDAVHAQGGKIVVQLWHVGRVSDPEFLEGQLPVAPSAVKPQGYVSLLRPKREFVTPRALERDEIKQIIQDFKQAALNAKEAGFDGVELHGANGYLPDQFLQDSTNKRTDDYGGSIENRARFMLEVTDALIDVWGSSRVGVHLSPGGDAHDIKDSDPLKTFSYVCQELSKRKIAFIFLREFVSDQALSLPLAKIFEGAVIRNQSLTRQDAFALIEQKKAQAVAFGRSFIANPDLVRRLKEDQELNPPDPETFYVGEEKGYLDYPFMDSRN